MPRAVFRHVWVLAPFLALPLVGSGCGSSEETKLANVKQVKPPPSPKFEVKQPPSVAPTKGMGGSPPIDLNRGYRPPK